MYRISFKEELPTFLEIRRKARKTVNGNGLGKVILTLQAKLSAHLNQHSAYSFTELCRLVKAKNLAIYTARKNRLTVNLGQ